APGAASEGAYRHEGEEFMHVLSGLLELVLDGDQFFDLGPGDSLYFESRRDHSWRCIADGRFRNDREPPDPGFPRGAA
ncbi:cupin domain-containing protein, partial [Rhizobium leguminosarum]|uniref:cupin domain-containing protein n=1 Tax=Rhizobium leguminosarum TaxID=384 RepID=UPI003F99A525